MLLTSTSLPSPPNRIISLVPSITSLFAALDLNNQTVGITKFCIHPHEWFISKTRIGGTKNIHIDRINLLQPDLIIANKEENVKDQILALAEKYPVWLTDVQNYKDALLMIEDIGQLTHTTRAAQSLINRIRSNFDTIPTSNPIPAIYLIWKDPYMTIGGDTFIHSMMEKAGFTNTFAHLYRYPELTIEDMRNSPATHILLSSEPYPFKDKHMIELQQKLPEKKILTVNGEYFSWYGAMMEFAPQYFKSLNM